MRQCLRGERGDLARLPPGDPIRWLLQNASTPVRYRVYRDLLEDSRSADALAEALPGCREVQEIFDVQLPSGGWFREGDLYHRNGSNYGYGAIQQLDRLADCGLSVADPRVQHAVEYVLSFRTPDERFFWKRQEVKRGRGEYGCWTAMFYEGGTTCALLRLGVHDRELASHLARIASLQQQDGSWALRYAASGRPLLSSRVTESLLDRI